MTETKEIGDKRKMSKKPTQKQLNDWWNGLTYEWQRILYEEDTEG